MSSADPEYDVYYDINAHFPWTEIRVASTYVHQDTIISDHALSKLSNR